MKVKAIILSFLFLLTGSGLKIEVATCCDVFSGISLNFKDNGFREGKDCCACLKAQKKSNCCHTQSISTVINPVLGLQKAQQISIRHFNNDIAYTENNSFDFGSLNTVQVAHNDYRLRTPPIPILIQKRVLQI